MKKVFDFLTYVSFFVAVVSFILLIIAHFIDSPVFGTSPRAIAGFTFLSLVWLIAFNIMGKQCAEK
jgi:hypothetical protein